VDSKNKKNFFLKKGHSVSLDSSYHKEDIPLNGYDDKGEFPREEQKSTPKKSILKAILKPSINFIISSFLAVALLLLFIHADGKELTYTIIGLKIPSLMSLMLAIIKIFICSGIAM
jgi:hypothetical protein